jgi:DNA-directed RNA polymerase specialized sigma24 family protein
VEADDAPLREIAVRLDTDQATVRRWLEHADAFLRARLEEPGPREQRINRRANKAASE